MGPGYLYTVRDQQPATPQHTSFLVRTPYAQPASPYVLFPLPGAIGGIAPLLYVHNDSYIAYSDVTRRQIWILASNQPGASPEFYQDRKLATPSIVRANKTCIFWSEGDTELGSRWIIGRPNPFAPLANE